MVRNWEIIREILLRLESESTPNCFVNANSFTNFSEQEVAYNMRLLHDDNYIDAKILNSSSGDGKINVALATRLTAAGHDLLDTIRNDTVWAKIKEKFANNGLEMTFDLVITVGKKIIESILS